MQHAQTTICPSRELTPEQPFVQVMSLTPPKYGLQTQYAMEPFLECLFGQNFSPTPPSGSLGQRWERRLLLSFGLLDFAAMPRNLIGDQRQSAAAFDSAQQEGLDNTSGGLTGTLIAGQEAGLTDSQDGLARCHGGLTG